jgi:acyl dehydratase
MDLAALAGRDLGTRRIGYDDRDVILYALSVGATADQLDLVFERDLRVLPTFALTLGVWAADEPRRLGAYESAAALHGAQTLTVHEPLPPAGEIDLAGRVAGVWDKGTGAVLDVVAECRYFTATYALFVRGHGGWGGERGPAGPPVATGDEPLGECRTTPEQAALYRLTGDRHHIHIDPDAAVAADLGRPVLHGLCTLGLAARELAGAAGAHPCDLRELHARFAYPVWPGDTFELRGAAEGGDVSFRATVGEHAVLTAGHARFA